MGLKKIIERKKIRSLPKQVADRIAAGEVVDRPISIVKELVENSIDSGADTITLEIKNGGKTYIRVTDNGCGIPSQEVESAFCRHATSKIATDDDLMRIETLGFRGEALASIAAVTRTQMITKVQEEAAGVRLSIEGGRITEKMPVGASDGTTIIVTDLFYNTPAREKFMKKDSAESALIIDFISKMTLAYPEIRFKLINNEKMVFATNGKGDVLENIYMVYGKEIASELLAFESETETMKVKGYISTPIYTKHTKRNQFFFVNGRSVTDALLEESLRQGYRDKLPEGRQPVAYLFLEIPPDSLDVNVHPNKKEVRFANPPEIREFVRSAVFARLNSKSGIGNISSERILKRREPVRNTSFEEASVQEEFLPKKFVPVKDNVDIIKLSQTEKKQPFVYKEAPEVPVPEIGETTEHYQQKEWEAPGYQEKFDLTEIEVLGVLFHTYIAARDWETFYLIDQHAAHERVFYETFLHAFYRETPSSQMLLAPFLKEIPLSASEDEAEWLKFLKRTGFELEAFGGKTYRIQAIPSYMELSQAERFLDDYLETVSDTTDFKDRKTIDRIILKSCKSAVKANDKLSKEEITALLRDLSNTENPFSCPHGRPVIIKMTAGDMEKMFKRK